MSAIIGISDLETIQLLTDAAHTRLDDGVVAVIQRKQLLLKCSAVVASMGLWSPVLRFARMADERANTFDELVAVAPELWDKALAPLPDSIKDVPCAALVAGYSEERGRVEMRALQQIGNESGFSNDLLIYAAGPAETSSCREFTDTFCKRFATDPRMFDACHDGIAFMQQLRRQHPRQFERTQEAAVGGYITWTSITREGIETCRIHEWPDWAGRKIDGTKPGLGMAPLPS